MKHALIASLGGAPQIITEALWAMMHPERLIDPAHRQRLPIAPDSVHILATSLAWPFRTVTERDLTLRAKIEALYRQYGQKSPQVDIVALQDGDDNVADIRTQRQNIVYANTVTRLVRQMVKDDQTTVHMLLAGGRKSMSSYDQSAMMFFGRAQDELMHVLVDPDGLERCREFWWPDQAARVVSTAQDDTFPTGVDSARIDLVNVPFVRLGVRLPDGAPTEAIDYDRLIEFIQFEQSQEPVIVNLNDRSITAGSETVVLMPGEFVLFALLVIIRKAGWLGVGTEEEGTDGNAAGWVALNDIRYGMVGTAKNPGTKFKRAMNLATELRDVVFAKVTDERQINKDGDYDWVMRAQGAFFGGMQSEEKSGKDETSTIRSRCSASIREGIKNPFIAELLAPASYGRGNKASVGLKISQERMELRGFEALADWFSVPAPVAAP